MFLMSLWIYEFFNKCLFCKMSFLLPSSSEGMIVLSELWQVWQVSCELFSAGRILVCDESKRFFLKNNKRKLVTVKLPVFLLLAQYWVASVTFLTWENVPLQPLEGSSSHISMGLINLELEQSIISKLFAYYIWNSTFWKNIIKYKGIFLTQYKGNIL